MYVLEGSALQLEAYDGQPAPLTSLPVGEGIHGRAVADGTDINIPDVSELEGHVACAPGTRSELIVLIRRHEEILGEISMESDRRAGFTDADRAAVKEVADALAALL